MKNAIAVVSSLLFLACLLITHYEVPMAYFAKGLLWGLSLTGSVYTLMNFNKRNKQTA
ncbi:hypothetical protein [Paenibacillus sp. NPDC057967]|uniref:hypothetical protein n=1 Tax=Paenibacillus sp. NPDC057967 TaxID=3346293 RepID=UPI0036DD66B9